MGSTYWASCVLLVMKDIVKALVTRYGPMLDHSLASDRLRDMMIVLLENADDWPVDKTNRWLGFIQGVMWTRDLIDIDEERNFTRPLFHAYYEAQGIEKPTSVDVAN